MGLLGFILFGFIVGLLARAIMPGRQAMGFIMTTVLGIAGSFMGGFIASLFSRRSAMELTSSGIIGSIIGALILLALFESVQRRRSRA